MGGIGGGAENTFSQRSLFIIFKKVGWGEGAQARRLGGFGGFGRTPPLDAEVRLGKTDSQFVKQVVVTLE